MADITERIEKQMEGTNLALAAVAEVLQKMDFRLTKEDEQAQHSAQANAQASARADLVKSIANEVLSVIKEDYQGLEVSGKERKAKTTGGTPQNADDSESGSSPTTAIGDQQNTIQAMRVRKQGGFEEEEDEEETQKAYKGMRKEGYEEEEEDEVAELPVEEKGWDDEEEEEEPSEMKAMRKQIQAMKKQLEATEAGMQKAIQSESENRLRKMGFREETGLQAPKLTSGLGVDSTPIIKSNNVDVVDQLADLSYGQLRDLQYKIEMGQTDGLPRELIG
tara:strand:+ start:2170 stop:3003 length:834 start_codon:yes stop_codon:yes gene_type:complete